MTYLVGLLFDVMYVSYVMPCKVPLNNLQNWRALNISY